MTTGIEVMATLLQQAGDHLRRDQVAGVVEQLNGRRRAAGIGAEGDGIGAEAMRDDERDRRVAGLHGGFCGGGWCTAQAAGSWAWPRGW